MMISLIIQRKGTFESAYCSLSGVLPPPTSENGDQDKTLAGKFTDTLDTHRSDIQGTKPL
jgi:hypothetical protein